MSVIVLAMRIIERVKNYLTLKLWFKFRIRPSNELSEALDRIEAARSKPVAFAVRANVSFFGVPCDDCPASGNQVTFEGKINLLGYYNWPELTFGPDIQCHEKILIPGFFDLARIKNSRSRGLEIRESNKLTN